MATCKNCGSDNPQQANHCSNCGSALGTCCPICGSALQPEQSFCSQCSLELVKGEVVVFSCTATGVGGKAPREVGVLTLTNYRVVFRASNIPGKAGTHEFVNRNIRDMSRKAAIVHASKGAYEVTLKASQPKGIFKFASNDGKQFVKLAKAQLKALKKHLAQQQQASQSSQSIKHQQPNEQVALAPQPSIPGTSTNTHSSSMTKGLGVACFLIPFLGILVWLSNRESNPKKAKFALLLTIYPTIFFLFFYPKMSSGSTARVHTQEQVTTSQSATAIPSSSSSTQAPSHRELFAGVSALFEMECYTEIDNSYIYISDDNICWVEVYGDSAQIDKVLINTEGRTDEECTQGIIYQERLVENAIAGFDANAFFIEALDRNEQTGQSLERTVRGIKVEVRFSQTTTGVAVMDSEIRF